MVRSYWKGTLVAAALLGGTWLAWGQPMLLPSSVSTNNPAVQVQAVPAPADAPIKPVPAGSEPIAAPVAPGAPAATERIITVQDCGCPPRQCRVLREWVLADGASAMEVQALDNGEKMTIVCGNCMKCTPEDYGKCASCDYPCARIQGGCSKIFKWGPTCCAPSDCPKPPLCQPTCGSCGNDGCKQKGSLSDMTDKRFIDPCTGKFDYEKYLAELCAKHGDCGPDCGAPQAMPAKPEQIKGMPAGPGDAKMGVEESRWPILSAIIGKPIGVAKTDGKMEIKSEPAPKQVTTLPPVNDKDKAKTGSATASAGAPKSWFGANDDHPVSGSGADGSFDKDKYLAELRKKYGKGADTPPAPALAKTEPKKEAKEEPKVAKAEPKKPEVKPPTATPPNPATTPAPVAQVKPPAKTVAEAPQPTDWRKSWGKTESQVAKTDKPETPVAKAEPKKELPAAPMRPDPLLEPERYVKKPEVKAEVKPEAPQWKTTGSPSPLLAGSPETAPAPQMVGGKPMPAGSVTQADSPGKASTAKVPMGARSALAAYGDVPPGQAIYLPVPMVTMPPNAHMVQPPQVAQSAPPQVNQYFANAFAGPDAPIMPAGEDPQMAQNAFGNNPMMMQPPMGMPGMPMMPQGMPQGAMQQAMMQQAMMQQAMMQQAAMQQAMMQQGMMPNMGVAQAGYYPMPMSMQPYQQPGCDPQTAQNLMQTLRESIYPSQREYAAESLARIDWRTHPQVFDALLSAAREDPAPTVRSCCVRCLSSMNVNSALLAMTLQGLKNDTDPRVRTEVEQAMAKMPQAPVKNPVQPVSGTRN